MLERTLNCDWSPLLNIIRFQMARCLIDLVDNCLPLDCSSIDGMNWRCGRVSGGYIARNASVSDFSLNIAIVGKLSVLAKYAEKGMLLKLQVVHHEELFRYGIFNDRAIHFRE